MAAHTAIEWTDATWNPILGCSVISAGCKRCYAMKLAGGRLRNHPSRAGLTTDSANGPVWNGTVRLVEHWLTQPHGSRKVATSSTTQSTPTKPAPSPPGSRGRRRSSGWLR